jgi:hypothetical protein
MKLPLGADGELFASPSPAPRKHRAAVLGLHAAPETVGLRPVAVIGLKGAFRHSSSIV